MNKRQVPVPCGKCEPCIKKRVSAWSFRLMQQDRYASSAHFITLTLDNEHVHVTKNGFMGLDPAHLRNYFKRLRINHDRAYSDLISKSAYAAKYLRPEPIKYYAVGEYGGKSYRPHYHIILFNAELNQISRAWVDENQKPLGEIHYGNVCGASVGYTLKYLSKPSRIPMHRNDDRLREFARMSQGLGKDYLTSKIINWHSADLENRMYCNLADGRKISMPRYYKDRIYTPEQRGYLKGYHEQRALQKDLEQYRDKTGKHALYYTEGVKASFDRIKFHSNEILTL